MKMNLISLLVFGWCLNISGGVATETHRLKLARDAVSPDATVAQSALGALQSHGKEGFEAFVNVHKTVLGQLSAGTLSADVRYADRVKAAVDQLGSQKDCYASQMFWFTDLEKAIAEAKTTGKPILSLRLLGKLDEEYSCANSRFFRTTLYPNKEVSRYLRENFVLHWKSVRPVPKVTIDFGDGRKLERTITGNSIHYVLDSNGRPVDALPGLYDAKTFLKVVSGAQEVAVRTGALSGVEREEALRQYHRASLETATTQKRSLLHLYGTRGGLRVEDARPMIFTANPPAAQRAGGLAVGKGAVELPLVNDLARSVVTTSGGIEREMNDPVWSRIAESLKSEKAIDQSAARVIASKNPTATSAARVALTKSFSEAPLLRVMEKLERSIAEDTLRNEYVLHPEIHRWFLEGVEITDVDQLNRKVYAELFLTPDSDPWLGLVPADAFSALPNDGLVRQ